jgi:hypothetical protein
MPDNGYLPYKTINVLMDRDYLDQILEDVLVGKNKLSKKEQITFSNQFRHYIKVLGFRNPTIAPFPLQLRAYRSAFIEKDEVIPFTLSVWVKTHLEFADKVKTWMENNDWKTLGFEREYQESEGFTNAWPDNLSLDQLVSNFEKDHPDAKFDRNDLILMVIWLSGKLPQEESQL